MIEAEISLITRNKIKIIFFFCEHHSLEVCKLLLKVLVLVVVLVVLVVPETLCEKCL